MPPCRRTLQSTIVLQPLGATQRRDVNQRTGRQSTPLVGTQQKQVLLLLLDVILARKETNAHVIVLEAESKRLKQPFGFWS